MMISTGGNSSRGWDREGACPLPLHEFTLRLFLLGTT
jgi:hypothetical protein